MSTPLQILTAKYHAAKLNYDSLKEEVLAEVLRTQLIGSLSTTSAPLQAVNVKPAQKKAAVKTSVRGKRGKRGKLPSLYFPQLSKETPRTVKDLQKLLKVKYGSATQFLKTQVDKGTVIKNGLEYTLSDSGVALKEQLAAGGDAPVSATVAPVQSLKGKPADKDKQAVTPVKFGKPQKGAAGVKGKTKGKKAIAA